MADRCSASSKRGLWVPGISSAKPMAYLLTDSTPPATNMSPSPAAMAWEAMRMAWSDEAQYRLTVVPGTSVSPQSSAVARATL